MTDRPLREVIAEIIAAMPLNLADERLKAADLILAALPQTEGSETVREALEPFAKEAQHYDDIKGDSVRTAIQVQLGWLRAARQALALPVDGWRPEVRAFADLMEAQLRKNDHKGGWQNDRPHALLKRLYDEAAELGHAMPYDDDFDPENVGWEAADVANFAMMIADVCGALPAPPAPDRGGEDGKN